MGIDVRPVAGLRDLRAFVELPYRLHSTHPQWVPPLRLERYAYLSRRLNAYFSHGEAQYFLARRDGVVVGRITAQVDRAYNAYHEDRTGMFGFLELEDDPAILRALLTAAEGWLRTRGRDRMLGPMDLTMNDETGILIEGFAREPMVKQPWHPPYYRRLCEEAGLTKAMDLLMWELDISDRDSVRPIIMRLADEAGPRHGVTLRKMERRHLRRELDGFADVYNAAWSRNWGFVPFGRKDLDAYAAELQLVFDRDWFMVAEKDGETVGMAITIPDVNQVLRKMNGRLLPLGWWHFLRRRGTMTRIRVGFLGVKPEYQHTGTAALLYAEHFAVAARTDRTWGEMGWILETNKAMNRGMEAMNGRVVKKYRVYERVLGG